MTSILTADEEENLNLFMKRSNEEVFKAKPSAWKWLKPNDRATALKFLRPKKFDVELALGLMKGYVDIHELIPDWSKDSVREYVSSGVTLVDPKARDKEGRGIYFVHAGLQDMKYLDDWQIRVVATFAQMEPLLELDEIQENGFTIVLDLKGAPFTMDKNARVFFDALQNKLPAKLKTIFIVNPPWFFRVIYKVLALFLRKKIRDRIHVLDEKDLVRFIDPEFIPVTMVNGKNKYNIDDWIRDYVPVVTPPKA